MNENVEKMNIDNDAMLLKLKLLVEVAFYSLIPLAILSIVVAIYSHSLAVLSFAIDFGISFVVQLFAFQSIRAMMKSNVIKFPYGTGKLENFSGFLYGVLAIPTGFYVLYLSLCSLTDPSKAVSLSLAQLALIPSLLRSIYLLVHSRRLRCQVDSPMVESYYVNFKVSTMFDGGILLAFATAMLLRYMGFASGADYIDPMVSLFLGLYMLYNGLILTMSNFRILMDLPLPEDEQLKIMGILAREYENYENIGNIYTRRSGRQRFLDIELYLKEDFTVKDVACLQARIKAQLEECMGEISFNLIPLTL